MQNPSENNVDHVLPSPGGEKTGASEVRLFRFCMAAVLVFLSASYIHGAIRIGTLDEEIAQELRWYPRVVTELRGLDPADYSLMAPDLPPDSFQLVKTKSYPVLSVSINGHRIPLVMNPYASAFLFDLMIPIKKIFPYNMSWARLFHVLSWALVLLWMFSYETGLSGKRIVIAAAVLAVLHPFMFFIHIPVGNLLETGVESLTFITIGAFRMYQLNQKRFWGIAFILLAGLTFSMKLTVAIPLVAFLAYCVLADWNSLKNLLRKYWPLIIPAALPAIPPLYFIFTEETKANAGLLLSNLSQSADGLRNALSSFSLTYLFPEILVGIATGVKTGITFSGVHTCFAIAALVWTVAAAVSSFVGRKTGTSKGTPFSAVEICALLLASQFIAYIVLYRSNMDNHCFHPLLPFLFMAEAAFLVQISRSAARILKGGYRTTLVCTASGLLILSTFHIATGTTILKTLDLNRNSMVDLVAQRTLVRELEKDGIFEFFATAQTHAGMIEFLSREKLRPYHLYYLLNSSDSGAGAVFQETLENRTVKYYLFDALDHVYSGSKSKDLSLENSFLQAVSNERCEASVHRTVNSRTGVPLFRIYRVDNCDSISSN